MERKRLFCKGIRTHHQQQTAQAPQRLLNETRAKRLADYLLDAHKALEAFLPTSLLLATDKVLPFDEANSTLTIDTEQVGQFNVVDGQHRIRGLVLAAEKETDMNEFQVPVNIAVGLDEMYLFTADAGVGAGQKRPPRLSYSACSGPGGSRFANWANGLNGLRASWVD